MTSGVCRKRLGSIGVDCTHGERAHSFSLLRASVATMADVLLVCFAGMSCTEEKYGKDWQARKEWIEWRLGGCIDMVMLWPPKMLLINGWETAAWGRCA